MHVIHQSSCLRVLLKFKTLNPRGWFFSQQLAVCTLCKPNQSCPWFQTKSAWCLLASPPPKNPPPPPSPLRIIATKAEKLLLSPHLLLFCLLTCVGGGGGDAFSPAGGGPDGEVGGRWGEKLFLGKASFSWLEARTEGKLQLH